MTQYFPPELGAPQGRLSELGRELAHLGWSVEVLTALPNYPTGRVFPGYDPRRPAVETLGPLRVVRVPLRPASQGFAARLVCYLSFALSCVRYGPRLCARPDAMFVESPPLFTALAAAVLSRRWKAPFIFNVSDLWPESAVRMGVIPDGLLARGAEWLELCAYRDAVAVTGQSEEIIASITERYPSVRSHVLTNGVDPERFGPSRCTDEARALIGKTPGQTVFMYAGLFGHAQGLDQILTVAGRLRGVSDILFVLVGDGPVRARLEARVASENLSNVRMLPAQERQVIPCLLAAADAAIVPLGFQLPGAVPSKIYEAMASGIPIVLVAGGEPARKVASAGAGLAVPIDDIAALETAIMTLHESAEMRREMGQKGRIAAETTYDRRLIAGRFNEFLGRTLH